MLGNQDKKEASGTISRENGSAAYFFEELSEAETDHALGRGGIGSTRVTITRSDTFPPNYLSREMPRMFAYLGT